MAGIGDHAQLTEQNLSEEELFAERCASTVKVRLPWQCPSSAPVPPQGAPGGSGQLGTPRKRPTHWAPSHCLECSSQPPPKPPISPPLTIQAWRRCRTQRLPSSSRRCGRRASPPRWIYRLVTCRGRALRGDWNEKHVILFIKNNCILFPQSILCSVGSNVTPSLCDAI